MPALPRLCLAVLYLLVLALQSLLEPSTDFGTRQHIATRAGAILLSYNHPGKKL